MQGHTDTHFEEELRDLKAEILKMGAIVEEMIARSTQALVARDSHMAEEVMSQDPEVNQLEMGIDERCLQLLALRQPAASDLRFIILGLKISKDLERMGDLSVDICQQVTQLNLEPQLKPYQDLPRLAATAQRMVKQARDSFVKRDAELANQVCEMDDEADDLKDQIFQDVVTIMQKETEAAARGVRLILVARHLERIADHATNIAEEVIFMVNGKDIRHGGAKLRH